MKPGDRFLLRDAFARMLGFVSRDILGSLDRGNEVTLVVTIRRREPTTRKPHSIVCTIESMTEETPDGTSPDSRPAEPEHADRRSQQPPEVPESAAG